MLENELYPFQQLINEGVPAIMAGHLSIPSLADGDTIPSSLSKMMLKNLLRDEMNFKGVVISDALNMHAVSKNYPDKGELEWLAFDAGNDVLCFAENIKEGINTILKNASDSQIEESFERLWKLKEIAFKSLHENYKLSNASLLNEEIAMASLTLLKGAIGSFNKGEFIGLELNQQEQSSTFFNTIEKSKSFKKISTFENSITHLKNHIKEEKNILIALFPPKAKPANLFDIPKEEIDFINELIKTKNVILYLFGNPYVLNHMKIDKAIAVVIAYQNFKEFQENAAQQFLGKQEALGKVPVIIK